MGDTDLTRALPLRERTSIERIAYYQGRLAEVEGAIALAQAKRRALRAFIRQERAARAGRGRP